MTLESVRVRVCVQSVRVCGCVCAFVHLVLLLQHLRRLPRLLLPAVPAGAFQNVRWISSESQQYAGLWFMAWGARRGKPGVRFFGKSHGPMPTYMGHPALTLTLTVALTLVSSLPLTKAKPNQTKPNQANPNNNK